MRPRTPPLKDTYFPKDPRCQRFVQEMASYQHCTYIQYTIHNTTDIRPCKLNRATEADHHHQQKRGYIDGLGIVVSWDPRGSCMPVYWRCPGSRPEYPIPAARRPLRVDSARKLGAFFSSTAHHVIILHNLVVVSVGRGFWSPKSPHLVSAWSGISECKVAWLPGWSYSRPFSRCRASSGGCFM